MVRIREVGKIRELRGRGCESGAQYSNRILSRRRLDSIGNAKSSKSQERIAVLGAFREYVDIIVLLLLGFALCICYMVGLAVPTIVSLYCLFYDIEGPAVFLRSNSNSFHWLTVIVLCGFIPISLAAMCILFLGRLMDQHKKNWHGLLAIPLLVGVLVVGLGGLGAIIAALSAVVTGEPYYALRKLMAWIGRPGVILPD